jgi:ABC-type glutathione transport system ATPase component
MLLSVQNIRKTYKKTVHAVQDVSFELGRGEALGIVGESGSGKSTLARIVMRLLAPDGGKVVFDGDLRRKAQIVFQNPFSSFDPRLTIGASLKEALRIGGIRKSEDIRAGIEEALRTVDLPAQIAARFPHEISGGECQRSAIARALSRSPELLVCDEPVSSLDLLAQARVLNLLLKLRKERSISLLFISHDLRVVRHLCDRVLVLKEGAVCEQGELSQVYTAPQHPYTRELLFSSGI